MNKNINESKKVLELIGNEPRDSTTILGRICNALKSTQCELEEKISPKFEEFIDRIFDVQNSIEKDDTDKHFRNNCFYPMIFHGVKAYKKSVKELTKCYEFLIRELIKDVKDVATKSIAENEMLVQSKYEDLRTEIILEWDGVIDKIEKRLHECCDTELSDSSHYNTVNHY